MRGIKNKHNCSFHWVKHQLIPLPTTWKTTKFKSFGQTIKENEIELQDKEEIGDHGFTAISLSQNFRFQNSKHMHLLFIIPGPSMNCHRFEKHSFKGAGILKLQTNSINVLVHTQRSYLHLLLFFIFICLEDKHTLTQHATCRNQHMACRNKYRLLSMRNDRKQQTAIAPGEKKTWNQEKW